MPSVYHRLNPLTKVVAAVAVTLSAFAAGGYLVPLGLLAVVVVPCAASGRVLARLVRAAFAVSLPIGIAVVLVSVLTRAGTTVLFRIGPFDPTLEGADFAGQVVARLFVSAMALGLFGLTTDPRALVADLQRRGLSPRIAFAVGATVDAIPLLLERAAAIRAAQAARGLETSGGLRARAGALLPLVGPMILGSLTEVEERSLALEARAFGRPGQRQPLWTLPDDTRQRFVRWAAGLGTIAFVAGRVAGVIPRFP